MRHVWNTLFSLINSILGVGLQDWRNVYLLAPEVKRMVPEVYKGNLVYRVKGFGKRISYA